MKRLTTLSNLLITYSLRHGVSAVGQSICSLIPTPTPGQARSGPTFDICTSVLGATPLPNQHTTLIEQYVPVCHKALRVVLDRRVWRELGSRLGAVNKDHQLNVSEDIVRGEIFED